MISSSVSGKLSVSIPAAGAIALFGSAAIGISISAWKKFELESKKLTVRMPGVPTKKDIHNKSFIGEITTDEYYVDDGLDSYSVEVTDLPGFAVAF